MKCIEPSEECLIDTSYGHLWVPSRPRCSCGLLTTDQGFEFVSIEVNLAQYARFRFRCRVRTLLQVRLTFSSTSPIRKRRSPSNEESRIKRPPWIRRRRIRSSTCPPSANASTRLRSTWRWDWELSVPSLHRDVR